jgi:hypothetical protein
LLFTITIPTGNAERSSHARKITTTSIILHLSVHCGAA